MLKLTLFLSAIIPLSWSLLLGTDFAIAQETTNSNQIKQEVADVNKNIIYVNPHRGNDNAVGNRNSPLKTITQALRNASPNTVISLASGTYSENTGETFPLIIKKNITLQGRAATQGSDIIIKGGGDFISPTGAGQNVAIAIIKDRATITGITVTNPRSRGHGIWIESTNPTITDSSFIGNGNTGISANGKSNPILEHNYFFNNLGNGLLVYGTSHPQVSNNVFERTGFGISIVKNSAITLQGNKFNGNRIGVIFEGNSQGILRNNQIFGSLEYGLVAIANSRVDLGNNEQSGGNIFRSNGKLDIQNITKNSLIAVGTEVQGKIAGLIDFKGTTNSLVTINSTISNSERSNDNSFSRLREIPLNPRPETPANTITQRSNTTTSIITSSETLPSPPSLPSPNNFANNNNAIINDNLSSNLNNESKELVFSAPVSDLTGNNYNQISSLGDVTSFSNTAPPIRYRVLVEASNSSQQAKVRSLYPDAFRTVYQGKTMLQVGAFSQHNKAATASRSLANLGLKTHILE
ncbi:MAG: DUF1565 domain-containing protein [Xenococcus sp. (in: cyanobacteria)]